MSKHLETSPNNLPIQLSSFIGRERAIAELKNLLPTTRLLTLTGAGGSGKTRLALQVATGLLPEFEDGVWWVELASLTDPVLVPQQVASSLDLSEQPGRSLIDTLTGALQLRKLLLVLALLHSWRIAFDAIWSNNTRIEVEAPPGEDFWNIVLYILPGSTPTTS